MVRRVVILQVVAVLVAVRLLTQAVQVAPAALLVILVAHIAAVKVAVVAAVGALPAALEGMVAVVAEARQLLSTATQPTFLSLAQFTVLFLKKV